MYSIHKNVQILIALLKEHGVRHIVCSAGTRNISFVFSVLGDDFFKCYSIVDERSAAFFAIGIMQMTKEPCAIVCTSGTAAANYLSAVTEAYYQHLPLVVLTSDRHHYYLNQQEDQCIPQLNLYHDVIRKVVDLPIVNDQMDEWYCGRLVNEALLELNHRETGPVQINFQVDPKYPINGADFIINKDSLPKVKKITRIMADDSDLEWINISNRMKGKKILICYGQNLPLHQEEVNIINDFGERYDVVFYSEHISNLHVKNKVKNIIFLDKVDWNILRPDIIITMGGHRMIDPKFKIRKLNNIEHWHVSPNGDVSDVFKCQTLIIECKQLYFFRKMSTLADILDYKPYFEQWCEMENKSICKSLDSSLFNFSQVYAIKKLMECIPLSSTLHVANSNSIRILSYLTIPESISVYCNRGACGIDGSMSSYIANSYLSNNISFLLIGDLSFFYDMNALWNNYISPKTRILLCNNSGGAILNWGPYKKVNIEGASVTTSASHQATAKGWVESRGFKYLSAYSKDDFDKVISEFIDPNSTQPVLLEVFTNMDDDIKERGNIFRYSMISHNAIQKLKKMIPPSVKEIIKGIINA